MLEYMLTFKNGFNGGVEYYKTHHEAVKRGLEARKLGLMPEAVYRYNEATGKYDILIGKFTVKEV